MNPVSFVLSEEMRDIVWKLLIQLIDISTFVRIQNKVNIECSVRQEIERERAQNRTKENLFIIMTLPLFIQNKDSYNG